MKFNRKKPEATLINLTPLIDVVFLLLVFFMVSTRFDMDNPLQVMLPSASSQPSLEDTLQQLTVVIDSQGRYLVNNRWLANSEPDTLRRFIEEEVGLQRHMPVIISADALTPHQAVVTVLDVAGKLGFSQLRILTASPSVPAMSTNSLK